jgi:hypothetical protein
VVFIPVQRLRERLHGPRSRVAEVEAVRRTLTRMPTRSQVGSVERAAAERVTELRQELSAALTGVSSCATCAVGYPPPAGQWDGGNCCQATTSALFDENEIAALRLTGTTIARLKPPTGAHAGCAFRGAQGCSLEARDRPVLCVRYVCKDLARELHAAGQLDRIDELRDQLGAAYEAFERAREDRLLDEALGAPAA